MEFVQISFNKCYTVVVVVIQGGGGGGTGEGVGGLISEIPKTKIVGNHYSTIFKRPIISVWK